MQKWLMCGLAFLLTVFVCLVPLVPQAVQPESVYEGRSTSAWVAQLQSDDEVLRRDAAQALGNLGPDARIAVPALIHALEDRDPKVRFLAARSLGQIGPEAKEAVPALRQSIVNGKDSLVMRQALASVRRIEGHPSRDRQGAVGETAP